MTQTELEKLLIAKTKELGASLYLDLLRAHIQIESNWDPSAIRYEPNFKYMCTPEIFAKKNRISLDTEKNLQKFSYGLFQVMGCVIRELGYEDLLLTAQDPAKNMEIGIKYYLKRCVKYPDITDRISAYNAGSPLRKQGPGAKGYVNQAYVDKVLAEYHRLVDAKREGGA